MSHNMQSCMWCDFSRIIEMDFGKVDEVLIQDIRELGRYDLQGNLVDEHYDGLIIIRYSDNSYKKYLKKERLR